MAFGLRGNPGPIDTQADSVRRRGAAAARRIGFQTDSLTGLKTFFTVISWGLAEPVPTSNPEEVAMRFAKRRTSPPPPAAAGD